MNHTIPNHVGNVHANTFTHQGMAATLIDDLTLLVHHIVIFEQTLTDAEIVLFHLLLGTFDALVNHLVLNHFSFLKSETIHHFGDAVAGKEAHEFVFQ